MVWPAGCLQANTGRQTSACVNVPSAHTMTADTCEQNLSAPQSRPCLMYIDFLPLLRLSSESTEAGQEAQLTSTATTHAQCMYILRHVSCCSHGDAPQ